MFLSFSEKLFFVILCTILGTHFSAVANEKPINSTIYDLICKTESNLILKEIHYYNQKTTIVLEYFNAKVSHTDDNYIFINTIDTSKTFYVEDINNHKKFFVYKTNIGTSIASHTKLKLGETKIIEMELPALDPSTSIFNIREGMEGGEWTFSNIHKLNHQKNSVLDRRCHKQRAIQSINNNNWKEARKLINDYLQDNKTDAAAHNISGILHFQNNNLSQAIKAFEKAVEYDQENYLYFSNLYYLSLQTKDLNVSLEFLNAAIRHNPEHPDYLWERAFILFKLKKFELSLNDFIELLSFDRFETQRAYLQYNIVLLKLILEHKDACIYLDKTIESCHDGSLKSKLIQIKENKCNSTKQI